MNRLSPLLVILASGLFAAGCHDDPRRATYDQDSNDPRLASQRLYEGEPRGPLNFGREGTPSEKRLDRGVPENSSTNPRNENNIGGSGGPNPSSSVP